MPGNPFKSPFKGGRSRATPKSPQKVNSNKTFVPRPTSSNGVKGKAVTPPRAPRVRVTTKARKSMPMPPVRQGAQMGTPGKSGSRRGAPWE